MIKAVKQNNLERVRLLLEQGADKDQSDNHGYSPLWWASYEGHVEVTKCLVEQGAALEKADEDDNTPLTAATANGYLDLALYLLEQGADRDKANNDGRTPLHWAAFNGHLEIAMLLMRYGADLNARNNDGKLPIDVAITEEIKQAIRDEPRRRMDEAPGKRATEQDRHPNAATSASAQQEVENEVGEEEQSNIGPRLDQGPEDEEIKVAEEDEDSEPSSAEEDND